MRFWLTESGRRCPARAYVCKRGNCKSFLTIFVLFCDSLGSSNKIAVGHETRIRCLATVASNKCSASVVTLCFNLLCRAGFPKSGLIICNLFALSSYAKNTVFAVAPRKPLSIPQGASRAQFKPLFYNLQGLWMAVIVINTTLASSSTNTQLQCSCVLPDNNYSSRIEAHIG